MKRFEVFFEFFSRKMKIKLSAKNEQEAKEKVKDKIKFVKVEEIDDVTFLKDLFGFKKK